MRDGGGIGCTLAIVVQARSTGWLRPWCCWRWFSRWRRRRPSRRPAPRCCRPAEKHFGSTYEELSARWWTWALEEPAATNPVLDESGGFCREGQGGRVWFLAGTFFGGEVERTCTIPKRRALFVPLVNCWADNSGAPGTAVPPTDFTEAELRGLIAGCVADAHDLLIDVDGEAVEHFAVPEGTGFSYRIPGDSVHDVLTGSTSAPARSRGDTTRSWPRCRPGSTRSTSTARSATGSPSTSPTT